MFFIQKVPCNYPKFSNLNRFGNAIETIDYVANGEATDWMAGAKNIFAFSPELGDSESENAENGFYPSPTLHEGIVTTDYKLVETFMEMHIPTFELIQEMNPSGNLILSDQLQSGSEKIQTKKWDKKGVVLELFNKGVSNLENVQILVATESTPPKDAQVSWDNSEVEQKVKIENLKLKNLGFSFYKAGVLTTTINIKRRSYLYVQLDWDLGKNTNFVLVILKDGAKIGKFVNVNEKSDLVNIFSKY